MNCAAQATNRFMGSKKVDRRKQLKAGANKQKLRVYFGTLRENFNLKKFER